MNKDLLDTSMKSKSRKENRKDQMMEIETLENQIMSEDDYMFGHIDGPIQARLAAQREQRSPTDTDSKSLVVNGRRISLGECTFIF